MGLFDNIKRKKLEKDIDNRIEQAKREMNSGSLVSMFLILSEIPDDNSYRQDEIRRLKKLCDEKMHQQVQENNRAKAERAAIAIEAEPEAVPAAEAVGQSQPEAEEKTAEDTQQGGKTFEQWIKAAEAGDADAMMECYRMYMDENNPYADTKKAAYWLNKAFERYHPDAAYEISTTVTIRSEDKDTVMHAYRILERLGENGMVKAMAFLTKEYAQGNENADIRPDMEKSLYWEEKFAEATCDEKIMGHLAELYSGKYYDGKKAIYWIEKSLKAGYPDPAFRMSLKMYATAKEDADFYELALNWMKMAADMGHVQALEVIGELYARCIEAELKKEKDADGQKLKEWAAAFINSRNFEELKQEDKIKNLRYMAKIVTEHGYTEDALEYLGRAAKSGDKKAMDMLAVIYLKEQSDFYNSDKALYWSEKSGNAGDAMGCMRCVSIYMDTGHKQLEEWGCIDDETLEKIYYWLDKATEYGDETIRNMANDLRQNLEEMF